MVRCAKKIEYLRPWAACSVFEYQILSAHHRRMFHYTTLHTDYKPLFYILTHRTKKKSLIVRFDILFSYCSISTRSNTFKVSETWSQMHYQDWKCRCLKQFFQTSSSRKWSRQPALNLRKSYLAPKSVRYYYVDYSTKHVRIYVPQSHCRLIFTKLHCQAYIGRKATV